MSDMDRNARAALRKELQRAEEEWTRLDVVIRYLRERLGDPAPDPSTNAPAQRPADAKPASGPRVKPKKKLTAAAAAHQILKERGTPMRTPELLEEARQLGSTIKDVDGLYRSLHRDPRFVKVGRGLWGLTIWNGAQERPTTYRILAPPSQGGTED